MRRGTPKWRGALDDFLLHIVSDGSRHTPIGDIVDAQLFQAQTQIAKLALAAVYRSASALTPEAKNGRQHSKRYIFKLARHTAEFGLVMPILVDRNGGVVAGNGPAARRQATRHDERVPTICPEHFSDAQITASKFADNRLGELSS